MRGIWIVADSFQLALLPALAVHIVIVFLAVRAKRDAISWPWLSPFPLQTVLEAFVVILGWLTRVFIVKISLGRGGFSRTIKRIRHPPSSIAAKTLTTAHSFSISGFNATVLVIEQIAWYVRTVSLVVSRLGSKRSFALIRLQT